MNQLFCILPFHIYKKHSVFNFFYENNSFNKTKLLDVVGCIYYVVLNIFLSCFLIYIDNTYFPNSKISLLVATNLQEAVSSVYVFGCILGKCKIWKFTCQIFKQLYKLFKKRLVYSFVNLMNKLVLLNIKYIKNYF